MIVGAGIGGAALAKALADDGRRVLVLEQTEVYEDRVRGEAMVPWGVAEARALGVEQVLLDAGARVSATWNNYHLPDQRDEIPAGMLVPDVPGSLNLRHPEACGALEHAARAVGATVHRGARDVDFTLGAEPRVRWRDADGEHEVQARIVVGADGRRSRVRKALGLELDRAPVLNHVTGLLLEDLVDVDGEHDFLAGEGDLFMATFHQHGGRARAYLFPSARTPGATWARATSTSSSPTARSSAFPSASGSRPGVPRAPSPPIRATTPGSTNRTETARCSSATPAATATRSSARACRSRCATRVSVRDVLRGDDWSRAAFGDYGEERRERMRRLRFIADTLAITEAEHADNREARRAKWGELMATDPRAFLVSVGALAGPETVPEDAFADELHAAVRAA